MPHLGSMPNKLLSLLFAAILGLPAFAQHGENTPAGLPAGHPAVPGQAPAANAAAATPAHGQDPAGQATPRGDAKTPAKKPPEKPGIPVEDLLVRSLCSRCHAVDDRNHMTRISYVRKSPEGWAESIKRMGRLHGLQLTPTTAKMLVRSLSNSHGLARAEAERGLYESERRVHWSEDHHDNDFKQACAQCHPLGRVLLQHRDRDEWQLLRATHVAMFPLSRGQMGGGPPQENRGRGGPPASQTPPSSSGAAASNRAGRGSRPESSAESSAAAENFRRGSSTSVGDRVLDKLSEDQPLFTPEWEAWTQNKREVPLQGIWTVHGHETGRGDVIGTLQLTRTDEDEYDLLWQLRWSDGSTAERAGKGVLYAGYSWRGRSTDPDGTNWREVLLLDDQWQSFRGRLFTGNYDEIGVDLTLHRDDGRPRIIGLLNGAIEVPSKAAIAKDGVDDGKEPAEPAISRPHLVDVIANSAFPDAIAASDFFVGAGLTISKVERVHDRHVQLTIHAEAGAALGSRIVAYGANPGGATLTLYDTVDYVRVRPLQGLSRNGGAKHPRQLERFEAIAMHRGKDGVPFNEDDVDLFQVRGKWALAEFAVRDDDDDLQYVGSIDPATGVFTPNVDGPNPARKWQANNIGDVYVTFEATLDVPVRPIEKAKPKPADGEDAEPEGASEEAGGAQPAGNAPAANEPAVAETPEPEVATPQAVAKREQKTFFARSHLIVTVPIYVRWQVLDWEDR